MPPCWIYVQSYLNCSPTARISSSFSPTPPERRWRARAVRFVVRWPPLRALAEARRGGEIRSLAGRQKSNKD